MTEADDLGVVVACHNDGQYLERCIEAIERSLVKAGMKTPREDICLVLDRCSDSSSAVAARLLDPSSIVVKVSTSWKSSYAENLNIGAERFLGRRYFSVVDSDMMVDADFFAAAIAELERGECVSVSTVLYAEPSTAYNSLYHRYEKLMEALGLNKRLRKHGQRVYSCEALRRLNERTGRVFDDVLAPDSTLDARLGGRVEVLDLVTWHMRKTGLRKSLSSQVRQGKAMREMGKRPRSVFGEVFRLRGVVFFSYLLARPAGAES